MKTDDADFLMSLEISKATLSKFCYRLAKTAFENKQYSECESWLFLARQINNLI